jgi:hypothetical protein
MYRWLTVAALELRQCLDNPYMIGRGKPEDENRTSISGFPEIFWI